MKKIAVIGFLLYSAFILMIFYFELCGLLAICHIKTNFMFSEFPIAGMISDHGEYFPLPEPTRYLYSVYWYLFLFCLCFTLPLCLAKCFKSQAFYQTYKAFWKIAALFFTFLTGALIGIVPNGFESSLASLIVYIAILSIALIPAKLQNQYFKNH